MAEFSKFVSSCLGALYNLVDLQYMYVLYNLAFSFFHKYIMSGKKKGSAGIRLASCLGMR